MKPFDQKNEFNKGIIMPPPLPEGQPMEQMPVEQPEHPNAQILEHSFEMNNSNADTTNTLLDNIFSQQNSIGEETNQLLDHNFAMQTKAVEELKAIKDVLSKEEEPKPEVQKVEILGAQLITIKGDKGEKGEDGYTPVKGKDYDDGKDGYTPVKDKDYFDGKDGKTPTKSELKDIILPLIPAPIKGEDGYTPVKGKDYFDGKNGEDGKDFDMSLDDLAKQINDKLQYDKILNAPKYSMNRDGGISRATSLSELTDVNTSGVQTNQSLKWNGSKWVVYTPTDVGGVWGAITGDINDQTDLQAALAAITPTLTNTYVGVGDGSNVLSGSSDFTYNANVLGVTGRIETGTLNLTEYNSVSSPSAGKGTYYAKDDGKPYYKNSAGTDYSLAPQDVSGYAKLDGTNQPFTGDLDISKVAPEYRLTDTEYTRLTRVAASNEAHLYNRVAVIGGDGTGGTITHSAGKTIHTFTATGSDTFVPPAGLTTVEVLVVAGGGGGAVLGGGGGGGGVVYHASKTISGSQSITVGVGGTSAGNTPGTRAGNGGNSVFGDITAVGGGGGASQNYAGNGADGGSGGGTMPGTAGVSTQGNSGGGTGYGHAGGLGIPSAATSGGGGGGAGAVGSAGLFGPSRGGAGGAGMAFSISGASVTYAGGGGGGAQSGTGGAAGAGGGGGGSGSSANGGNGTDGLGGGGGSTGYAGAYGNGGTGGSGVVIVSYTPVSTTSETNIIKSIDSATGGIAGVTTFGDDASDTIVNGNTIKLNIGGTNKATLNNSGNLGIGITPTSVLTLKAGSATAGTAPLKLTSGTLNTTAEVGAVEFLTDKYYGTITTGAARKEITMNDSTLTSGKIPIASTNGRLIDGQTPLSGTKVYYVSDTSGGAVTRKLTFINGILTSET